MSTGNGEDRYVDTLMYYQHYVDNAATSCPDFPRFAYKNPTYQSAGNVASGSGFPGYYPHGSCRNSPYGSFPLSGASGWSQDSAKAFTEQVNGTLWGFNFSASAGFTTDVLQDYESPVHAVTTYICGNGQLPNMSRIYNTG